MTDWPQCWSCRTVVPEEMPEMSQRLVDRRRRDRFVDGFPRMDRAGRRDFLTRKALVKRSGCRERVRPRSELDAAPSRGTREVRDEMDAKPRSERDVQK